MALPANNSSSSLGVELPDLERRVAEHTRLDVEAGSARAPSAELAAMTDLTTPADTERHLLRAFDEAAMATAGRGAVDEAEAEAWFLRELEADEAARGQLEQAISARDPGRIRKALATMAERGVLECDAAAVDAAHRLLSDLERRA